MDLTSKQRAQLRGLANSIDTIVQVGKDGIGDNLIKQVNDAARAEVVQVIGTKFVLYRKSHRKDLKDPIVLVKDRKKQG